MKHNYKGKRQLSGKWIKGYLYQENGFSWILSERFKSPECSCEILTETICQSSSIIDKDGIEIFSDDLRTDTLGKTFRIYQTEGGFAIKAYFWCDDINDLTESDALILTPLVDAQTRDWLKNSTTHVGNIYDKN